MAKTNNQVKFWRGAVLPTTKDTNTLYFDTTGKLYLGETLIADVTVLDTETVNSLVAQALNQYYTKAEIDGFIQTLNNSISEVDGKFANYRTSAAQDVIDQAQDKALTDYKAEMVETLKGYQTTIPAETYDAFGSAATAEQNAKDYTDAEITGLEFGLSDDGKTLSLKNNAGTAVATLDTSSFVKDGMISSVAISEDGANLVITWNTDAGKEATNIPLTELVDVMTGVDGTTVTVSVSADDKISAEVKAGSITTSHIAANAGIVKTQLETTVQTTLTNADTAYSWGNHATQGYLKAADIANKADKVTGATNGNFAALDGNGNLTDSGKKAADFVAADGYVAYSTEEKNKLAGIEEGAEVNQTITTGNTNGSIAVDGTDVAVKGLGSAAFSETTAYATAEQGTKADNAATDIAAMKNLPFYNIALTDINNWNTAHTEVGKLGDVAYLNTTSTGLYGGTSENDYADMANYVPTSADVLNYLKAQYRGNAAESVNLGTLVVAINSIVGKQATTDNTVSELNQALCWEE